MSDQLMDDQVMVGNYFIGLISGTSVDGIDACLIRINDSNKQIDVVDTQFSQWDNDIKAQIKSFLNKSNNDLPQALSLDMQLGIAFAKCTLELTSRHQDKKITAIGSHGQTLRHSPNSTPPYTYQVGNGAIISQLTKITTVNDFRSQDISLGGQGAPLAPLFHQQFFSSRKHNRAIINIGGISNITYLPCKNRNNSNDNHTDIKGFDSGPGNGLMDAWIDYTLGKSYDKDGLWASSGKPNKQLLAILLQDDYIGTKPPKSTGPEHYNLSWLSSLLENFEPIKAEDVQATLLQFTTKSITENIKRFCPETNEIYLCGGGANNPKIISSLQELSGINVFKTDDLGISCDWIEACLFAWLAAKTLQAEKIDLSNITGSKRAAIAGCIWQY